MDMTQQFIITVSHQLDPAHRLKHIILRTWHFGNWLCLCTQVKRGNKKQPVFNTRHGNNPLRKINNQICNDQMI